jgi:hypothetical protein
MRRVEWGHHPTRRSPLSHCQPTTAHSSTHHSPRVDAATSHAAACAAAARTRRGRRLRLVHVLGEVNGRAYASYP